MKSKLMFSILIPNYGYSPFIFDCLDSVINQKTNNLFSYEILVCDQSDYDIHLKIKNKIKHRYSDRVVFYHSDIKGLAPARHNLISKAIGDYIIFVDSDDFIKKDSLISLYEMINKNRNDLYIFNYNIFQNGQITKTNFINKADLSKFTSVFLFDDVFNPVWLKIFKKDLYNRLFYNQLPINLTMSEDKIFSTPIVLNAKNIWFEKELVFYNYRIVSNSMTRNKKLSDCVDSIFLNNYYEIFIPKNNFEKEKLINSRLKTFVGVFRSLNYKISFSDFKIISDKLRKLIQKNMFKELKFEKSTIKFIYLFLEKKFYRLLYLFFFFNKKVLKSVL